MTTVHTWVCIHSSKCSLSLGLQHGEVEVDQLQVAGGCGVVAPPQLRVEHLSHVAHTGVDLAAHLGDGLL